MDTVTPLKRYSLMVKVGNWLAEKNVMEENLGIFFQRRDEDKLEVQRTRNFLLGALRRIEISPKKTVRYGSEVQLLAQHAPSPARRPSEGLSLSCVLTGSELTRTFKGYEGTYLTGSPMIQPCGRNVFEVCPVNNNVQIGDRLQYGRDFALRYVGTSKDNPYYVTVLPPRMIPAGNPSRHPIVHLSSRLCRASTWQAQHQHGNKRKETEGQDVPPQTDLVVTSAILNTELCCEAHTWFSTIFGLECEATAHTYYDCFGREGLVNIWSFNAN